ncbi:uncharacterized protein (DUF427 family) [Microbacterium endophyticum]|uniref:Uncharacterized protein (DUF427 family) n=1 Tax=Microbacterium endophyticum TaxID=1526412 RepID=A0A7W4V4Q4_9MICO|nr:DUF427 domain-containing protein [Microbacterium endophyticum]MBB2976797.1 uncharacterized protein (DUF427 family) [Microbacterium endophyticum]NIK36566.1 uncharacterized protein (DUF427 family) [Microbacterium endophyticum]
MKRPIPDRVKPGQESVWDYPRPPRLERQRARITITFGGVEILDTDDVLRVLETSHPPVYYLPEDAFETGCLVPASGSSMCEWKGAAHYFDVVAPAAGSSATQSGVAPRAAWGYARPMPGFELLRRRVAVYPQYMDRCTVDGETAVPQPGEFYGGWITSGIVGPFKGIPGSHSW